MLLAGAAKVTGRQILDALEFGVSAMPEESGGRSVIFKIGSNVIISGESSYETEENAELVSDTTYISYDAVVLFLALSK